MKKFLGILCLLIVICAVTAALAPEDSFLAEYNLQNVTKRSALFGIISIGVAFVIITGGIDLSIGSIVGLTGCLLPLFLTNMIDRAGSDTLAITLKVLGIELALGAQIWLLVLAFREHLWQGLLGLFLPPYTLYFAAKRWTDCRKPVLLFAPAIVLAGIGFVLPEFPLPRWLVIGLILVWVIAISLHLGLLHGLLITKLRLQPFVVTLCGLLFYRGFARWLTDDKTQGFGKAFDDLRQLGIGKMPLPLMDFQLPIPMIVMLVLMVAAAVFLNQTIYGRYLLALGRNEEAARYSGINTDRMVILAYVLSAATAGVGGILFALDLNSIQPSGHGEFYELYAIAAAVLGGCSLRGGEGSISGVVIGAAVLQVIYNSINLLGISTKLEFAIMGLVLLIGVIADELVKRFAARRRALAQARAAARSSPKAD